MNTTDVDIGSRVEALDLTLFDTLRTQSSEGDRRAWLAVQRSVRSASAYSYLEIGSYLGGSLQQHLVDPKCQVIVSIDKRPLARVPDEREEEIVYEANSTSQMLGNLARVSPEQISKVTCFDDDVRDIDPTAVPARPDFCFIDGEHTYASVISDFDFCFRVCSPDAAILFHDDAIIWKATRAIVADLRRQEIPFTAYKLTGGTFGIFLRSCPAIQDPYINRHSRGSNAWFWRLWVRSWVPGSLHPVAKFLLGWIARP